MFCWFKKSFRLCLAWWVTIQIITNWHWWKTFDVIQSMYRNSRCAVKIGIAGLRSSSRGPWSEAGMQSEPNLFTSTSTSWQKLWTAPATSRASLYTTPKSNACCMRTTWFLMSPTAEGLQHSLALLEQYCEEWALTVNLDKTRVMVFQKKGQVSGSDTSSVTEEKFWSTAPATLTWASRSLHQGGLQSSCEGLVWEGPEGILIAIKSRFGQLKLPIKNMG